MRLIDEYTPLLMLPPDDQLPTEAPTTEAWINRAGLAAIFGIRPQTVTAYLYDSRNATNPRAVALRTVPRRRQGSGHNLFDGHAARHAAAAVPPPRCGPLAGWDEQELRTLRRQYAQRGTRARVKGRSSSGVRAKARKLGLEAVRPGWRIVLELAGELGIDHHTVRAFVRLRGLTTAVVDKKLQVDAAGAAFVRDYYTIGRTEDASGWYGFPTVAQAFGVSEHRVRYAVSPRVAGRQVGYLEGLVAAIPRARPLGSRAVMFRPWETEDAARRWREHCRSERDTARAA